MPDESYKRICGTCGNADYEHRIVDCVKCEYEVCSYCTVGMKIGGCKFCDDIHPIDSHKNDCGNWQPFFPISIGL